MNSDTAAYLLDRSMYYPGRKGTLRRSIRKYRDRAALRKGERVTVLALRHVDDGYGGLPRVQVEADDGRTRWIDATDVDYEGKDLEIRGW